MTSTQLRTLKTVTATILAIIVSTSIVQRNAIIPIIAVAAASAILFYATSRVKEVIADERDYEISGKAARISIQIFSFATIIPMIALYAMSDVNPTFEPVASALAYAVCFLMLTHAVIAKFLQRTAFFDRKASYIVLIALLIGLMAVVGLRLMSGEDDWICVNGSWVMHGKPSVPAPSRACLR